MIKSIKDIVDAVEAGRIHEQMFYKSAFNANAEVAVDAWVDWGGGSGKPGQNARIGSPGSFTPSIMTNGTAIWYPGIPAGMERRLAQVMFHFVLNTTGTSGRKIMLFDLVGVYPAIDGTDDSIQNLDNTQTLPRYTTGEGVQIMVFNHVTISDQAGVATIEYVDSDGNTKTTTFTTAATATAGYSILTPAGGTSRSTNYVPLAAGSRGVRRINSIQWTTAPNGLVCLYLVKPIFETNSPDFLSTGRTPTAEVCFCQQYGMRMPVIPDGACLNFALAFRGGGYYIVRMLGSATFIWG